MFVMFEEHYTIFAARRPVGVVMFVNGLGNGTKTASGWKARA